MEENITKESVLFSIESNELIIIFAILLFIFIVYFVMKNSKQSSSNTHDSYDRDEDEHESEYTDKEEVRTEQFYDDLAFMFPALDKVDNPLEVMKFLFENKENQITKEQLSEYSNSVSNFSQEGEHVVFDMDGTHFDFNIAQKEIAIDDSLHVFSNSSGLFFNEEDKSLKVSFHKEDDEYVVDNYSVKNPEGISHEVEEEEIRLDTQASSEENASVEIESKKEEPLDFSELLELENEDNKTKEDISEENNTTVELDEFSDFEILASDTSY